METKFISAGFAALIALFCLSGAVAAQAPVASPDPVVGNPRAGVHLVMYEDLECPKCAAFHKALFGGIINAYATRVEFEFRDFVLSYHPWSFNAALIARYLDTRDAKLGMDWRDYCFNHQDEIYPGTLLGRAAALCAPYGISSTDLQRAFSRPDLFAEISRDEEMARRAHLTGTPFVLVNGRALPDTATVQDLVNALNAALDQRPR